MANPLELFFCLLLVAVSMGSEDAFQLLSVCAEEQKGPITQARLVLSFGILLCSHSGYQACAAKSGRMHHMLASVMARVSGGDTDLR